MKGKSMSMLKGLTRKCPPGVDASMSPRGGDVNTDATRGGVAKTPRTIGPREA
jgi:hypothetical protein